jgi:hypothetical protein
MSLVDASMTRDVIRDIVKHPLDISELQVHVQHGVIYMSGRVAKMRGYHEGMDLHEEWNIILRILKQKRDIRDVICEVELDGFTLEEKVRRKQETHFRR